MNHRYAGLLARRVPRDEITVGAAYLIHARNGVVGIAVMERGLLGYRLHREKFGQHYLFVEYDWADDERLGTAIPLRRLPQAPPTQDSELLEWLAECEIELDGEIRAVWREIPGEQQNQE